MNKQLVPVDLIVVNAGTQWRPLDEEVLKEYMSHMKEKAKFPPVEIIREGDKYYLWDGFHRLECHKRLKIREIQAFVVEGTLKDAVWNSYAANKFRGLPREPGTTKKIIESILCDERWSSISQNKIAKHVGVTKGRVSQIKSELLKLEKETTKTKNKKPMGLAPKPIKRSQKITTTRDGKDYEQKSQEKQFKKPEPIKDAVGQIVPENLVELYESRKEIISLLKRLKNVYDDAKEAVDSRNPAFVYVNPNVLKVSYVNFYQALKSSMFHAVCGYCNGQPENCKACSQIGLLNKLRYAAVIKELKPRKKKADAENN